MVALAIDQFLGQFFSLIKTTVYARLLMNLPSCILPPSPPILGETGLLLYFCGRRQRADFMAEGRRQRAGGRRERKKQKAEGKRQKAEGGR
jgi:hypothetical protein